MIFARSCSTSLLAVTVRGVIWEARLAMVSLVDSAAASTFEPSRAPRWMSHAAAGSPGGNDRLMGIEAGQVSVPLALNVTLAKGNPVTVPPVTDPDTEKVFAAVLVKSRDRACSVPWVSKTWIAVVVESPTARLA